MEKLLSISNINRVQKFYKRLLKDLIMQGLLRLKELAFQLRCRKAEDGVLYPLEKNIKDASNFACEIRYLAQLE